MRVGAIAFGVELTMLLAVAAGCATPSQQRGLQAGSDERALDAASHRQRGTEARGRAGSPQQRTVKRVTIRDAVSRCDAANRDSKLPVTCRVDYIDQVPSMILGFRTRQQIDTYLEPLADRVAGPFCDAANRSNRRAAVYTLLAGRHARRFDCELHRWGQWVELEQNETRSQASRVTTISEAVQACKNVQASSDVPVGCDVDYIAGVPSMLIAFANLEHAKSYMMPMAKHVAVPFCNAANRGNRKANLLLVVGGELARPYSCELGEWGDWFELPDEEEQEGESRGVEI